MKPYKLYFVQAITADDKQKRKQFCVDMQEKFEEEEFNERLVFSDEATFYTNGKANRHNARIWGEENPQATIEHERVSPNECVLCHLQESCSRPVFLKENVTGDVYLQMVQNWLVGELIANEHENFIYQQDGASPHCAGLSQWQSARKMDQAYWL